MKDVNPLQRAAINEFMVKAKAGESNTNDWARLVEVMKEDNRRQYGEALHAVIKRRETSATEEETAGGMKDAGNLGVGAIVARLIRKPIDGNDEGAQEIGRGERKADGGGEGKGTK